MTSISELEEREMVEGLQHIAFIVRAYFEALLENGFSNKEALTLTSEYQTAMIKSAHKDQNESEE